MLELLRVWRLLEMDWIHFPLWDEHEALKARRGLLWFRSIMLLTGWCVEDLVPAGALGGGKIFRGAGTYRFKENGSRRVWVCIQIVAPTFTLLTLSFLLSPMSSIPLWAALPYVPPLHRPRHVGGPDRALKLRNHRPSQIFPPLNCCSQVFCHSVKMTNTHRFSQFNGIQNNTIIFWRIADCYLDWYYTLKI